MNTEVLFKLIYKFYLIVIPRFHCSDYSPMKVKNAVVYAVVPNNIFCVNLIGLSLFFAYKSRFPIKRGDRAVIVS
jgi:hypothetical protein